MPLCFSVKEKLVYIQIVGMSAELREEFHNFRRVEPIIAVPPRSGEEGVPARVVEGENYAGNSYSGHFIESDAEKIVSWLREKGAITQPNGVE